MQKDLLSTPVLKLLRHCGGYEAVAVALRPASEKLGHELGKQHVRYWVNNDYIPPEYWRAVCELLGLSLEEMLDHAEQRAKRRRGLSIR